MKIIECYVENFGKISARKFSFTKGLNCLKEDNGNGKTTLAAFIKVMLYGMSDTKKTSLEENDRKHYLPWKGGVCGGSLTFSVGKKIYRIERRFAQKASDDSFALYDTATGKECDDFTENLGAELFGIDADGFERTVFLSERSLTPKSENKTISAKLSDLVGCDGDIGEMDVALNNLEKQRKFYHKKGGAGEISDLKAKITEINRSLDNLAESEAALGREEKRMQSLAEEIKAARSESARLITEREKAAVRAADDGYEKTCKEMGEAIKEITKNRDKLLEFFGECIPCFNEIDEAAYKFTEAKNLQMGQGYVPSNPKYTELSAFFKGKTDAEGVKKIKDATSELKELRIKENSPGVARAKELFSHRIPSAEEIDSAVLALGESKGKKKIGIYLFCSLLCIGGAVGGALFSPLLFGICAIGILLAIIFAAKASSVRKKSKKQVLDFVSSVTNIPYENDEGLGALLAEMTSLIALANQMPDEKRIKELEDEIEIFVVRFGSRGTSALNKAEEIIKKYDELSALEEAQKYISENRADVAKRAEILAAEARAFLVRFRTKTSDPFSELRANLTEYNRLCAEISSRTQELNELKNRHALGEDDVKKAKEELVEIDRQRFALEDKVASLSREYALSEKACRSFTEELDGRDELAMRLMELEDTLAKNQENYETVLLTKKYLTVAKDNMTSRYIGKTKASFLKYTEIIGGAKDEEFEMDTDFGISKIEGASTKSIEAYSRGTRDLYNLASRLALVDSLYESEKPFIILDDPFIAMDDGKTAAALKLISDFAKERQVIYFTCSKSRSI